MKFPAVMYIIWDMFQYPGYHCESLKVLSVLMVHSGYLDLQNKISVIKRIHYFEYCHFERIPPVQKSLQVLFISHIVTQWNKGLKYCTLPSSRRMMASLVNISRILSDLMK